MDIQDDNILIGMLVFINIVIVWLIILEFLQNRQYKKMRKNIKE